MSQFLWESNRDGGRSIPNDSYQIVSRIAILSQLRYPVISVMKGVTIKLPEATLQRLKLQARQAGRSVSALVRERLEAPLDESDRSLYDLTSDLTGSLAGPRRAATNTRRKFGRR